MPLGPGMPSPQGTPLPTSSTKSPETAGWTFYFTRGHVPRQDRAQPSFPISSSFPAKLTGGRGKGRVDSLSEGQWAPQGNQGASSKSKQRKIKKQKCIALQGGRRWVQLKSESQVLEVSFPHTQLPVQPHQPSDTRL